MQVKDRDLISQLLDLSSELIIKGDAEAAMTCTQAAARILAIPRVAEQVRGTKGVTVDWNALLESMAPKNPERDNG